jgi:hypothetical protein
MGFEMFVICINDRKQVLEVIEVFYDAAQNDLSISIKI